MTFFQGLLRVLAAAGASVVALVVPQVIAYFQGAIPSDVSPVLWGIVSTIGVFVLNLLLAKYGPKPVP